MQGNIWGGEFERQAEVEASLGAGHRDRNAVGSKARPSAGMCKESPVAGSVDQRQPNERLKPTAHVDQGLTTFSSVRRGLGAHR
jgi:hypothetical protein